MSILPQIMYGNIALIFLSYVHGYNKNEIFAYYWDMVDSKNIRPVKCHNLWKFIIRNVPAEH
jgi:hypothetical protein